eukprot:TRINITY_DN55925_c0_g1_i1.p1 TRINITY_DN55925_c0_g1~~TRINITY_DN55925_c0_g1_i1.p1  ORF type:complete len:207 (+),score=70.76 TRINITY_DN55925_c0_g1_i1:93-713(+)
MAFYSSKEYWDRRYELNPQPYEWYQTFGALRALLKRHIRQGSRLLIAGCGNSTLGEDLYDQASFTDITAVDFSEKAIMAMAQRRSNREGLNYLVEDLVALSFPMGTFDCVIDKATLDSCICGDDESETQRHVTKILQEIARVLKKGGIFICISHSPREDRQLLYREDLRWDVEVEMLQKEEVIGSLAEEFEGDDHPYHYVYICRKR